MMARRRLELSSISVVCSLIFHLYWYSFRAIAAIILYPYMELKPYIILDFRQALATLDHDKIQVYRPAKNDLIPFGVMKHG